MKCIYDFHLFQLYVHFLHQVNTLEEQLTKREQKIKKLESQLSLTLSQVISSHNHDSKHVNRDDSSGSHPVHATMETVSTDSSPSDISNRRHSTPSAFLIANTSSLASRDNRASPTSGGKAESIPQNPLKPRWTSLREPKGPERPIANSKSVKNGWRPVSGTASDITVPNAGPNSYPTIPSHKSNGKDTPRNAYESPNRNINSHACAIS